MQHQRPNQLPNGVENELEEEMVEEAVDEYIPPTPPSQPMSPVLPASPPASPASPSPALQSTTAPLHSTPLPSLESGSPNKQAYATMLSELEPFLMSINSNNNINIAEIREMLFSCCDKLPFCMITNPDAPIRIKTLVLWNDVCLLFEARVCECSYADELALQLHCISCVLCEKNLFAILAFLYMHGHRITSIVTSMWDMKPINVCKVHGPYIKIILGRLIAGMCENVKSFNADVGFSWLCEYVRPTRITVFFKRKSGTYKHCHR